LQSDSNLLLRILDKRRLLVRLLLPRS